MTLDDLLKSLVESIEAPETIEDALEFINTNPICQNTLDELAFRQTIVNILIASGMVSENDFNQSINHFKGMFTQQFANQLVNRIRTIKGEPPVEAQPEGIWVKVNDEPPEDPPLDSDDWPDDKIGKA